MAATASAIILAKIEPNDSRSTSQDHLKVMAILRRWDPIGVISEDNQDEYDGYSSDVVRMLDRAAGVDDLLDYMRWVVEDRMGMTHFDEPHSRACAQELVDDWRSRKGR